jgi:hypothetical protein
VNPGQYKKEDFLNMLYRYCDIDEELKDSDTNAIKIEISKLKKELINLQSRNKLNSDASSTMLFSSIDLKTFKKKIDKAEALREKVIGLKKDRNRTITRKFKNESLIKELNSLHVTLRSGDIRCADCNSTNLVYSTRDQSCTFNVADQDTRTLILDSIRQKIAAADEEVERITVEINNCQKDLQEILLDDDVDLESLLTYKRTLPDLISIDEEITKINKELKKKKDTLTHLLKTVAVAKSDKDNIMRNILESMNRFYKSIDPTGNMHFDELFTTQNKTYSGSEEMEFYLSKIYAILETTKHSFPIIIDCFRDGELSSQKEKKVLELYMTQPNQMIFTATLKNEELDKYAHDDAINNINYSENTPSHVLDCKYVVALEEELKSFSIYIDKL